MRTIALVILALTACGPKSSPPAPLAPAAAPPDEPPIAEESEAPDADEPDENETRASEPADPRALAKDRYSQGRKEYDLGRFDAAVVEFEAAYALYPDKSFLFNIAQAHRQNGNATKAIEAYRRFLASDGVTAEMRTKVEAHIKELGGTP